MKEFPEDLKPHDRFADRHIGPDESQISGMLKTIGVNSIEQLLEETIPASIRLKEPLKLPPPISEYEFLNEMREIASRNRCFRSYIGLGYYGTFTPPVIQRNIFENPGWYTQYTPYQAEISQGRLEALLNFQTMVSDLTALPVANASLLDEATAAAEAMSMAFQIFNKRRKSEALTFLADTHLFPQTIDVLKGRAAPHGIKVVVGDLTGLQLHEDVFGIILQYPDARGAVIDYTDLINEAKSRGIVVIMAADLLSLALLKPPGELGADIAVGSTQRFGVPPGYGGPHAAYFATRDEYVRLVPGRIIGVSIDNQGKPALRMALQTREQHIRREKATSNICTAQALLAIMASMYAVYHGPQGIRKIATRIHLLTKLLNDRLKKSGYRQINSYYFDTLAVQVDDTLKEKIRDEAVKAGINFNYFFENLVSISLDETVTPQDLSQIISVFARAKGIEMEEYTSPIDPALSIPASLKRESEYLKHPVFNRHHSETRMLRYIKSLEKKDLSLTQSMIPLGSCTMKLNATSELLPLSWKEFADIHPFVPEEQAQGYRQIIEALESYLNTITGFDATSFQPNSGAQGELTGLLVIRAYFQSIGEGQRDIALIPSSAHGTNPASAVMAGMKVVVVKCDEEGNIDFEDLKQKAALYKDRLAVLMVTYPSTHGVFEESIREVCDLIHRYGGQVYMDGANMNAQTGLTTPAQIGADVCHLNLHKTFAIPHGGGGPGMGPICVKAHLKPFLPRHPFSGKDNPSAIPAVAAAPYGSPSILIISYGYIRMLGEEGMRKASEVAILNANYIKARLEPHYKVLYKGKNDRVAHELILDFRAFKHTLGVDVEDVAKRLMDYSFHAPTISFPVPGTMMIEPTESEDREELDRFCDALIRIRKELAAIEEGYADRNDNLLKNAPHTAEMIASSEWHHPYTREEAAFPLPYVRQNKFWVPVGRVNNPYGDRNLICTCPSIEMYETVAHEKAENL